MAPFCWYSNNFGFQSASEWNPSSVSSAKRMYMPKDFFGYLPPPPPPEVVGLVDVVVVFVGVGVESHGVVVVVVVGSVVETLLCSSVDVDDGAAVEGVVESIQVVVLVVVSDVEVEGPSKDKFTIMTSREKKT